MAIAAACPVGAQEAPRIDVYKDPSCTCCSKWVTHLRGAGFNATATDVRDIAGVKAKYHVPGPLQSCHTAVVAGYVIEGHVPAADIRRLLQQRPKVVGLAVPGMPVGSPGMEGSTGKPYQVVSFDMAGQTRMFSTQQPLSR